MFKKNIFLILSAVFLISFMTPRINAMGSIFNNMQTAPAAAPMPLPATLKALPPKNPAVKPIIKPLAAIIFDAITDAAGSIDADRIKECESIFERQPDKIRDLMLTLDELKEELIPASVAIPSKSEVLAFINETLADLSREKGINPGVLRATENESQAVRCFNEMIQFTLAEVLPIIRGAFYRPASPHERMLVALISPAGADEKPVPNVQLIEKVTEGLKLLAQDNNPQALLSIYTIRDLIAASYAEETTFNKDKYRIKNNLTEFIKRLDGGELNLGEKNAQETGKQRSDRAQFVYETVAYPLILGEYKDRSPGEWYASVKAKAFPATGPAVGSMKMPAPVAAPAFASTGRGFATSAPRAVPPPMSDRDLEYLTSHLKIVELANKSLSPMELAKVESEIDARQTALSIIFNAARRMEERIRREEGFQALLEEKNFRQLNPAPRMDPASVARYERNKSENDAQLQYLDQADQLAIRNNATSGAIKETGRQPTPAEIEAHIATLLDLMGYKLKISRKKQLIEDSVRRIRQSDPAPEAEVSRSREFPSAQRPAPRPAPANTGAGASFSSPVSSFVAPLFPSAPTGAPRKLTADEQAEIRRIQAFIIYAKELMYDVPKAQDIPDGLNAYAEGKVNEYFKTRPYNVLKYHQLMAKEWYELAEEYQALNLEVTSEIKRILYRWKSVPTD